jgi:hypothetical protein
MTNPHSYFKTLHTLNQHQHILKKLLHLLIRLQILKLSKQWTLTLKFEKNIFVARWCSRITLLERLFIIHFHFNYV